MSEPTRQPGASAIERRLRALERRRRALTVAWALALWICILLPVAAAYCLVDWYSHIPLVFRWLTVVGLVSLGWYAARRFVAGALRVRRDVDRTALTVEGRFPVLTDHVISSVQLDRHGGDPGYGSAELIAATQRQADEMAARVDFSRAAPLGRFLPLIAAGLLLLAGAGWAAAAFPRIVGVWAVRCVWKADYPHKTRIVAYPADLLVARGDAAAITVHAAGLLPDSGRLLVRSSSSGWVPHRLSAGNRRGEFVARIDNVVDNLQFQIELGDAPSADGRIRVTDRPAIASIDVDLFYPRYTGRPPDSVHTGHLRQVVGTQGTLTMTATKPLTWARLVYADGRRLPMEPAAAGDAARARSCRFTIERTVGYHIEMQDTEGFENTEPVPYKITAEPDTLPRITLTRPGAEVEATPVSVLTLHYLITDDQGLRSARLAFRRAADRSESAAGLPPASQPDDAWQSFPLPLPGLTQEQLATGGVLPSPGPRQVEQTLKWDLTELGFRVGDVIVYRLEATDHEPTRLAEGGKPGLSPECEIRVVSEERIQQKLLEHLDTTAQEIERLYQLETQSQENIRRLREQIRSGGATTQPDRP
ncbi:MAG: hypothetical protein BIFFINMI_00467 [Phycisphaerae bacterium]|nr:hypothetical protein [Phycisphaerae bacterium]